MTTHPVATPPRHVVFVVNPGAGGGRGARAAGPAERRLRALGLEVQRLQGRDGTHALELARAAVRAGTDALVVVGGDGMAHLGLQAVAGTAVPLGIVAGGTGNDLTGVLGIPRGDPVAAAEVVAAGRVRTIDAVRVRPTEAAPAGPQWWVGVLGAGFDSAVNERANRMRWPRGPRRYDVAILAELGTYRPQPFTLTLDDHRWETEATLVAVGNTDRYGGGIRMCPRACPDDGLLDVTVVGPVSKATLLRLLPATYKGTHLRHPSVATYRARAVSVDAPGLVGFADGERVGPLPITSECMPGALRVLT